MYIKLCLIRNYKSDICAFGVGWSHNKTVSLTWKKSELINNIYRDNKAVSLMWKEGRAQK